MDSSKALKALFRELGFHNSWGTYIHYGNHEHRIYFSKKVLTLNKTRDYITPATKIRWRDISRDDLRREIITYFKIKIKFKYGK